MLTCVYLVPLDYHQQSNMSSSNESLLTTSISVLNGLNYLVWENQMKAWLRSKGLWQITCRNQMKQAQVPNTETPPSSKPM